MNGDAPAHAASLPMPRDARALKVAEALLAQPALDWSIEAWGREVGASGRRTLARLFTEQTGLGFFPLANPGALVRSAEAPGRSRSVTGSPTPCYASDSAFIAMYRRVCGQSPGRALRGLEDERSRSVRGGRVAPFAER